MDSIVGKYVGDRLWLLVGRPNIKQFWLTLMPGSPFVGTFMFFILFHCDTGITYTIPKLMFSTK